jgi:23S rRNA (guanosine2251-2'-O)-methyltransferase
MGRQPLPRLEGDSLVYGLRSVDALMRADPRRIARLFVEAGRAASPDVAALVEHAEQSGVRVTLVAGDELAFLSKGAVHQGVLAEVAPFQFSDVRALVSEQEPALLLVLDEVTDPQNLGAAARAAWALGGTGLILPKDRSATVTAAAEKVASGALASLRVAQVTNLSRTLDDLKAKGLWILGLDVGSETPLWKHDLTMPLCLVVGSEATGMRRLTREKCDAVLSIPMAHVGASLNAADAAAVALYEVVRQRKERSAVREYLGEEE